MSSRHELLNYLRASPLLEGAEIFIITHKIREKKGGEGICGWE
jgi:hypothetical protein